MDHIKKQRKYSHILCILLFLPMINSFINLILQKGLLLNITYSTQVTFFIMLLMGIYTYWLCIRIKIRLIFIAFLFFSGTLISIIIYPEILEAIYGGGFFDPRNNVNVLFFYCLPVLFLTLFISNYQELSSVFIKYSIITLILGVCSYIFVSIYKQNIIEYMSYSYSIITATCFCFDYGMRTKNRILIFGAILGFLCIFFGGARGALLGVLGYFAIKMFVHLRKTNIIKTLVMSAFIIICLFIIYLSFNEILIYLNDIGKSIGINTRTLDALISHNLIESQEREEIFKSVWEAILNSPIIGYGLFTDRYFIGKYTIYGYVYAHNIVLELWCNFGFILGTIIILWIGINLIKKIFTKFDIYYSEILYAIIPYGLIQLLFSGSYLTNMIFFMLIGMLLKNISYNVGTNKL